jgi:hypothetical protein
MHGSGLKKDHIVIAVDKAAPFFFCCYHSAKPPEALPSHFQSSAGASLSFHRFAGSYFGYRHKELFSSCRMQELESAVLCVVSLRFISAHGHVLIDTIRVTNFFLNFVSVT